MFKVTSKRQPPPDHHFLTTLSPTTSLFDQLPPDHLFSDDLPKTVPLQTTFPQTTSLHHLNCTLHKEAAAVRVFGGEFMCEIIQNV